jgi:hypothetical protein
MGLGAVWDNSLPAVSNPTIKACSVRVASISRCRPAAETSTPLMV